MKPHSLGIWQFASGYELRTPGKLFTMALDSPQQLTGHTMSTQNLPPSKQPVKKRILFADREPRLCQQVKAILEQTGPYEVTIEHTALQALATAQHLKPNILLLDEFMPDMTDSMLLAWQKLSSLERVPVVIVTAGLNPCRKWRDYTTGFLYIRKPLSPEDLLDCLETELATTKPSVSSDAGPSSA